MLIITDMLFALVIAAILTTVFTRGLKKTGPWQVWSFYLVVFLGSWAGGVWISPLGRPLWGSYWLSILAIGVLVAMLLAAASPSPGQSRAEAAGEAAAESGQPLALGVFFWLLLIGFLMAIGAHYAVELPIERTLPM